MFNATYFTYDGVFSAKYGLKIADFENNGVVETSAFSPTFNVTKPSQAQRFFYNGLTYDSAPTYQFKIISEDVINETRRREILTWLVARDGFKTLKIHQYDLEQYWYKCVFSVADIIFINSNCHGFTVTANFDSPYQYAAPSILQDTCSGPTHTFQILNKSDIIDDYVYPKIDFVANSAMAGGGGSLVITNTTDSATRVFSYTGLSAGEHLVIDNELRRITSSTSGEKLSNFNRNWLRLRKGYNTLSISTNGSFTITCPTYVMMGF